MHIGVGGDIFVFLFFGLVGVLGSASLYGSLHWSFLFPALVAGAYSAAVLTLNNLRDVETDARSWQANACGTVRISMGKGVL